MHYEPNNAKDSDSIRLDAVMKYTRIKQICGVAQVAEVKPGNLDINFKAGVHHVVKQLQGCGPTIATLDYFWLENRYYSHRYGLNWDKKARDLFHAFDSLRHIILPCDRLSGELVTTFNVKTCTDFPFMLNRELHVRLLDPTESRECNPIVLATTLVHNELLSIKGAHTTQSRFDEAQQALYLARDYPFLCITRAASREAMLTELREICMSRPPTARLVEVAERRGNQNLMII